MITLIPTLVSLAVSGATKLKSGSDATPDSSKAGASGSTTATGQPTGNAPNPDSDFQSLLDWKHGLTPNAKAAALAANTNAQPAAGETPAGQTPAKNGKSGKADSATPVAAAPAAAPTTDMSALISASAVAGQAAVSPGQKLAVTQAKEETAASTAINASATTDAAVKNPGTDSAIVAGSAPTAPNANALAGNDAKAGAAASPDSSAIASPASGNADTAAVTKALSETLPATVRSTATADPAGASAQGMVLPSGALHAATNTNAPSAPSVAASIDTPVGAQGWDQALGQRVVWMVSQRNPTAELHVNPPDLGPLSVTVNVANNTATATFVAAHATTREAITEAMPRLKDMLASSGIALGNVTVSAESFAQSGGSSSGNPGFTPRDQGTAAAGNASAAAPSALVSPVRTSSAAQGLVDTFA